MAVIKCKMCGGDIELSPDKTFGVCECCGSTMTFPKLDDDQRAAAFNRGNYFRRIGEFDKALAVYERIVQEDETDAEAHWCCALCRYGIEYVEDPTTHEYLPTCHRASFDSFLEDVDYKAALQYSDGITKRQYEKDAAKIAEVQHGILATCQNEQPFDVFICYKESDENGNRTKDSTLAQEIYYQLTDQGLRVFFARITLEDKAGTEYEPYIFAALNSARVMVAVGTKPEYFSAVWVKNEWSRFLAMMKKDRSKLLLPCYRDMDPYDLPEALAVLQSYDMSKIGFIQDLTRGISKVLDAGKQPVSAPKETVVVQNVANTNVNAQIKRGNMALADGEWEQAKTFFNQALDMDAECAEAYLGLALAEAKAQNLDTLRKEQIERIKTVEPVTQEVPFKDDAATAAFTARDSLKEEVMALCGEFYRCNEFDSIFEYDDSGFTYPSCLSGMKDTLQKEQTYYTQDRYMGKTVRFAKDDTANMLKAQETALNNEAAQCIAAQKKAEEEKVAQLRTAFDEFLKEAKERGRQKQEEIEADLESQYRQALEKEKTAKTLTDYHDAQNMLAKLNTYKDAKQYVEEIAAQEKKKEKKNAKLLLWAIIVSAIVGVIYAVVVLAVVPQNNYNKADELYKAGDYTAARAVFEEIGDYKDSAERAKECGSKLEEIAQEKYEQERKAAYEEVMKSFKDGRYNEVIADWTQAAGDISYELTKEGADESTVNSNPYYVYCQARIALENNDTFTAYSLFKSANANDSAEYVSSLETECESAYQEVVQSIENNTVNWSEAIDILTKLGNFKDAEKYCVIAEECKNFVKFYLPNGIDYLCVMVENKNHYMYAHGSDMYTKAKYSQSSYLGTYCGYVSVMGGDTIDCENYDEAKQIMQEESEKCGGLYMEFSAESMSRKV